MTVNKSTFTDLSGGGSNKISSCEVKITDGCHSDSVVGVIILHRLGRACDSIFQIIFSSL